MAKILIIDDDRIFCNLFYKQMSRMGHEVTCALAIKEGLNKALSGTFDVVFLDVRMPDGDGLNTLPRIKEITPSPEVIIITSSGDPDGAELAIKSGAWDYIEKPLSIREIKLPLIRALQYREEKKARKRPLALKREGIVGNSQQIRTCINLLAQASNSDMDVLITGETGTGKELFARAIHDNSTRSDKSFVVVDCTALPETLIESILFGYEKGAFTGADKAQAGLIKQADGGTLFLDEMGELSLSLQKAFLRVLEGRRFRPLGSKQEIKSDFRLITATNRNLHKKVQSGQFRKDLLFRLQSLTIELPPLREHSEDIKVLTIYYTNKLCERYSIATKGFSPEFIDALVAYDWPGNVRELVHAIERAISTARYEPTLFPKHLPTNIRVQVTRDSIGKDAARKTIFEGRTDSINVLPTLPDFRQNSIAEAEQKYLQDLMALTSGNIKEACQISGLSRSRLYALLQRYKISTNTM